MPGWLRRRRDGWGVLLVLAAAGACSVDTSDIVFERDDTFNRPGDGGVTGVGGVVNIAGVLGKGGSDSKAGGGSGGASTGGSKLTAGTDAGGSAPTAGANLGGMGMGGAPPNGYPCSARLEAEGLIANFTGLTDPMESWAGSNGTSFGLYSYPPDATAPLLKLGDGALTVEAQNVNRPQGFGIWFSPCVDAKTPGFSRISFQISGTRDDGMSLLLRVGLGTNDTSFADPMFQSGGCVPPMGQNMTYCRPAGTEVEVTAGMPPGMTVTIPFSQFQGGSPVATVEPSELHSVEWGFIYLNGEPAYGANVRVDDVRFQ